MPRTMPVAAAPARGRPSPASAPQRAQAARSADRNESNSTRLSGSICSSFDSFLVFVQARHHCLIVLVSLFQSRKTPVGAGTIDFETLKDKFPSLYLFWGIAFVRLPSEVITEVAVPNKSVNFGRERTFGCLHRRDEPKYQHDDCVSHVLPNGAASGTLAGPARAPALTLGKGSAEGPCPCVWHRCLLARPTTRLSSRPRSADRARNQKSARPWIGRASTVARASADRHPSAAPLFWRRLNGLVMPRYLQQSNDERQSAGSRVQR